MLIGSLFSGIGGFELGVLAALGERGVDADVAWQVEIDPFCRAVLAKHFPRANRSVSDVRRASANNLCKVDIMLGGFPCQDISGAGSGEGLSGARSGLWWEDRRIIAELRPLIVLTENVASGMRLWLGTVRCSLESLGYRTVNGDYNRKGASVTSGDGLRTAALWPTPDASGAGSNRGGAAGRSGPVRPALASAVKACPTPRAVDGSRGPGESQRRQGGPSLLTAANGKLNPDWVESLMGFPPGWTSLPYGLPAVAKSSTHGSRRARLKTDCYVEQGSSR